MNLKDYLPTYEKTFKKLIGPLELLASFDTDYVGEHSISCHALPELMKKISKMPHCDFFVSTLFFDALTNSTSRQNKLSFKNICKRSVLVINKNSLRETNENVSHQFPQIILGLKTEWSKEDINTFKILFKEYIELISPLFPEGFFSSLKTNQDIRNKSTDYKTSLGIVTNIKLINCYLDVLDKMKDNS